MRADFEHQTQYKLPRPIECGDILNLTRARSFDTIFGVSIVILFPRFDDVYKHVQKIVAGFRVNPISLVLGINGLFFQ